MNIRGWLASLYPYAWRRRYGREFEALLEECPISPLVVADIVMGALDAQLHVVQKGTSNWRIAGMERKTRGKELAVAATIILTTAILDIHVMALVAFARLEGMAAMAALTAAAGVAATAGFVVIGGRRLKRGA